MLHVAAAFAAFVNFDFFICDAIAIGVAVGPEVEGVGDANHDAVIEREGEAGKEEVVDKGRMFVVLAITVGVLVAGDAGLLGFFTGGVGVLHVGAHFDDVKGSVTVPGHGNGLADVRVAKDEFEGVVVLKFDGFLGLFDGEEAFLINGAAGFGEKGAGEEEWDEALHEMAYEDSERLLSLRSFF